MVASAATTDKDLAVLDRPTILAAALELVDEGGLEGFTLRALGERLGVRQMAAYRHFENKAAIIDALADQLLEQVRLDDPTVVTDPDELILGYLRRARSVLLAHPALVPVVAARPLVRSNRAEDLIRLSATFSDAGFPDETIVESVLTLVSITLGLIVYEQQRMTFDRAQGPSYQTDRLLLLAEMIERPDAPKVSEDLMRRIVAGDWGAEVFETTITDAYESIKRRAGAA